MHNKLNVYSRLSRYTTCRRNAQPHKISIKNPPVVPVFARSNAYQGILQWTNSRELAERPFMELIDNSDVVRAGWRRQGQRKCVQQCSEGRAQRQLLLLPQRSQPIFP